MKRAAVIAGVVILGIVVWPRDRGGIVLGEWSGKTTQDQWVMLVVDQGEDGLEITRWGLGMNLTCAKSGRVLRAGLVSSVPVPIRDRSFNRHTAEGFAYIDWSGVFSTAKSVEGVTSIGFPTLLGDAFDALDAEACKVGAVGFAAHPGAGEDAHGKLDVEVIVARDGATRVVWNRF